MSNYTSLYNDFIPKVNQYHFKEMLKREVSNLFKWQGLEDIIQYPLLERLLIEEGQRALIHDELLGYLVLPCTTTGEDLYSRPTKATVNVSSENKSINKEFRIYYPDTFLEDFKGDYCILIENMESGQSLQQIINFYSYRLGMLWTSIDINLLWQNLPPIFAVPDKEVKTSIDKMVNDIWSGKPVIVTDRALFGDNNKLEVAKADIPLLFNELHKAHEQVLSDFRSLVGINTSGTMKESGIGQLELTANSQSIRTCLEVMLSSRNQACLYAKNLFQLDLSVSVVGENEMKGGLENGTSDDRIKHTSES